jgi:hypothetical protein
LVEPDDALVLRRSSMTRLVFVVAVLAGCGKSNNSNTDAGCVGATGCNGPCELGNSLGVGRYCTAGGGECNKNDAPFIFCTVDYEPTAGVQYCTGPCTKDTDCGENAYCSGSGQGGRGCEPMICGGMPSVDAGVDSM